MSARRDALRRAAAATRPRWRLAALSALLATGAVLCAGALLAVSGYLVSRAAQRPEILLLTTAIVGVRFFAIARAILRYLERIFSHDLAFRTLTDLRVRFFRRLVPLVPGGLPGHGSADLLSRFVADADRLQDLYLRGIGPPVVALLAGTAAVVAAAFMLPAAALVIAIVLLLAGAVAPPVTRAVARRAGRRQAAARAALSTTMVEIVGGAPEIALAGREEDWQRRADAESARLGRVLRGDALASGLAVGAAAALAAGAAAATAAVAVPAVHDGALAGVLLAALVLLAFASLEAVTPLSAAAASLDAVADAAARLEDVTERPPPVVAGTGDPPAGDLELRGVRFRYGDGEPLVLDGVDLRLAPGRAVAIAGPSGAGKTTLAELLVRFRDPTAGSVAIGGADLRELDPVRVRDAVRLGAQEAYLFATSIGANVALARPGAERGRDRGRPRGGRPRAVAALAARRARHRGGRGRRTGVGRSAPADRRGAAAALRRPLPRLRRADDAPRPGGRGGAAHPARGPRARAAAGRARHHPRARPARRLRRGLAARRGRARPRVAAQP